MSQHFACQTDRVLRMRRQIDETNALLERLERDLAANPQRDTLALAIDSLTRRRRKLEAELSAASADDLENTAVRSRVS